MSRGDSDPSDTTGAGALGETRFSLGPLGGSFGSADVDLADLIERTKDAVILIDADDVIRYWNEGAEAMFQYARAEVVGRRIGFLVPPDLVQAEELAWIAERIASVGHLSNFVTRRVRKDGVERWVSLTRSVLHDTSRRVLGSSAVFRDVTEERRVHEDLARARGMAVVGEMSVTLAHEIKNRLAGIQAAIQLLARRLDPADPQRQVYADVLHEVRRLDATARDLLRFARPSAPDVATHDLAQFLEGMRTSLERREDVRRHRVELDVPAGLVAAFDAKLLGQALSSLILNAAQAMREPAAVRVSARLVGDGVGIEVADSGPGIADGLLRSIFDPYFTTKAQGTGLGLSIARKNVEAHGGNIHVESRAGVGSCFTIWFPRASAGPRPALAGAST